MRLPGAQCGDAGFDDRRRRREIGFSDFQMNDVVPGRFQFACPRQDRHDAKRLDILGALGDVHVKRGYRCSAMNSRTKCSGLALWKRATSSPFLNSKTVGKPRAP